MIPALVGSGLARLATELGALTPQLLVNATPLGMAGGAEEDRLPVPSAAVESADTVFDVVAFPSRTPLGRTADPPPRKKPGGVSGPPGPLTCGFRLRARTRLSGRQNWGGA